MIMADRYAHATAGDNANDGTSPASAWRTLTYARQNISGGDRLFLSGTFNEAIRSSAAGPNLIPNGSSGNPTIITNYVGETATIQPNDGGSNIIVFTIANEYIQLGQGGLTLNHDGSDWTMASTGHLVLDAGGSTGTNSYPLRGYGYIDPDPKNDGPQHIKLHGVEIKNAITYSSGIETQDWTTGSANNDWELDSCWLHDNGEHGMYCSIAGVEVHHSLFENNIALGAQDVDYAGENSWHHNVFRNNGAGPSTTGAGGFWIGGSLGYCHFYNNIVYQNQGYSSYDGSGLEVWGWQRDDVRIYNNTFYDNEGYGIRCRGDGYIGSGGNYENNISYGNDLGDLNIVGSDLADGGGNWTGNDGDPQFTNVSIHDFTLQSGSSCIDYGNDLSSDTPAISDDFSGNARPSGSGYDAGCFERVQVSTPIDYYVDVTNGDDSTGTGTSALPWKTVVYSLTQISSGDGLILRTGTYPEAIAVDTIPDGDASNSTIIKSYPGEDATLQPTSGTSVITIGTTQEYIQLGDDNRLTLNHNGSDWGISSSGRLIIDGVNTSGEAIELNLNGSNDGAQHIYLKGVEIKNAGNKGFFVNNHSALNNDVTLEDCWVHDSGQVGVGNGVHGFSCERCLINDNTGDGVEDAYSGSGVTYNRNVIRGNANGIEIWGSGTTGNSVISNNLIYDNTSSFGIQTSNANSRTNLLIYNNTIDGNTGTGFLFAVDTIGGGTYDNNIVTNNSVAQITDNDADMIDGGNNLTSGTLFVDRANHDFRLLGTATTAIDQGTDLSGTFTDDFEGNVRPSSTDFDIGAYEHSGPPEESRFPRVRIPTFGPQFW